MFVARNQKNQLISLLGVDEKNQKAVKAKYFCPVCQGEVILKRGQVKIAHFAHRSTRNCQGFSEGETTAHLFGKKFLYEWDERKGQLEASLPEIQQRPDLLLSNKLAVELQCSPLSIERLHARTFGYRNSGYRQWWLLGGKLKEQTNLTKLTKNLCYFDRRLGVHFWSLDAEGQQLMLNFHVLESWNGEQSWKTRSFSREDKSLEECFKSAVKGNFFHYWRSDISDCQMYREKLAEKLVRREPGLRKLQEHLYVSGSHLQALPLAFYSISDFSVLFGDWVLFFRYLIYQRTQHQGKKLQQSFVDFQEEVAELLNQFQYPLMDMEKVLYYFFFETIQLLTECRIIGTQAEKNIVPVEFTTKIPMKNMLR